MSFGTHERKVRDPSLAYGQRINALVGCVERYSPVGFHVTFGYLEHVAGHFRRDEAALLRVMDALSSSRNLWLIELTAYANKRKAAKRLGRRSPPKHEADLLFSTWYGDARNAAMFALGFLLRAEGRDRPGRAHTTDAAVLRLAAVCLEHGRLRGGADVEQARLLQSQSLQLRQASGWPDIDWPNWHKAHDSLWALQLIGSVSAPEP
jgi:hypothetical protein